MRRFFCTLALGIVLSSALLRAGDVTIISADRSGNLVWSNAFTAGVVTVIVESNFGYVRRVNFQRISP